MVQKKMIICYCSDLDCLCSHPLVTSILDKEILRIQLLTLWDSTRSSADISNKYAGVLVFNNLLATYLYRNLRFSSYRSLYFWIHGKKNPSREFRSALPSCLVSLVKQSYPEADGVYTGFVRKLPRKC